MMATLFILASPSVRTSDPLATQQFFTGVIGCLEEDLSRYYICIQLLMLLIALYVIVEMAKIPKMLLFLTHIKLRKHSLSI